MNLDPFLARLRSLPAAGLAVLALLLTGCATVPSVSQGPQTDAPTVAMSAPAASAPAAAGPAPVVPPAAAVTPSLSAPAEPSPAQTVATPAANALSAAEVGLQLRARPALGVTPPVDLWDRIRRGFAMPDLDSPLVREREQWYAARPDHLLRMTERSRRYLFHIVEEIERRNMPTELALLPFIESAFNPQAVSPAKAAGMWQFMPATGRDFDLKQNMFRDERRDILESTRAALDYLQKLYGMFNDWHLALAAYNWGEGSVGRALARNRAQDKPLAYTDLRMPDETRHYVPKLQAIKNIIAQPQLFNATLPDISNHPFFRSVTIERDIDVAVAARLAEISLEDFRALNPSMNRPLILGAGRPQILLPWDNADVFERNLQAQAGRRLSQWTAWVAPRNMKAAEVAEAVGMKESDLRQLNQIPPRMLVKAGSTLLVHRKGALDNDVHETVADRAQLSLLPELVLRSLQVAARKGDTMASLAARHGVSAASLASWNKLRVDQPLKAGQRLMVLVPAKPNPSEATRATRKPSKAPTGKSKRSPRKKA